MAKMNIDIIVKNIQDLDRLKNKIDNISSSADDAGNKLNKMKTALAKQGLKLGAYVTGYVALATVIGKVGKAFSKLGEDALKYGRNADQLADSITKVTNAKASFYKQLSDNMGLTEQALKSEERTILMWQRLQSIFSDKTLAEIQRDQWVKTKEYANWLKGQNKQLAMDRNLRIKGRLKEAKVIEDNIKLSERFAKAWADSEMEEQIDQEAHALAEANIALKKYNDELRERARIARQIKQDAKDAEGFGLSSNIADHDAKLAQEEKALKDNTKAVEENTLHVMQWSKQTQGLLTGYFENGKYQASVGERSAIYKESGQGLMGGMDLANKSQMASLFANLANSKKKHSGSFSGDSGEAKFEREKEKKLHILDIEMAILEKRLAVEKVTLSYATKRLEADKARLADAQDLVSALNSGLKDFVSQLENVSKSLKEDYVYRAKGSLFGHSSSGNTFANAKREAKTAWNDYQNNPTSQEFVNVYRDKMDRVIASLDEFKDTSKYNSQAEMTFAKHKALRDVKDFQKGQDIASVEVDKSILELKKLVALTTVQSATELRSEQILNRVKSDTAGSLTQTIAVKTAIATGTNATASLGHNINRTTNAVGVTTNAVGGVTNAVGGVTSGVDLVKGAVNAVKTATQDVENSTNAVRVATDKVNITTDKIVDKKTERARTVRNEWTQTGATLESKYIGSDYQIKDQNQDGTFEYGLVKKYSAVAIPTFGLKSNSGTDQGYRQGGYTGDAGVNSIAGQVHGQEYVLNASTTKNLGLNNDSGGVFTEMSQLMYEQLKVTKRMYGLEKQMLKIQKEEVA